MTSKDTPNATSSPESADGVTPSALRCGATIDLFGQEAPPCQPFSSAGEGRAQSDERHLWPHWMRLIRESKPATIFGEQVATAISKGWLDDAFLDLEKESYACAAAVLPACGAQKGHERPRLWFVAHSLRLRPQESWVGNIGNSSLQNREATCFVDAGKNAESWFVGNDGLRRPIEPEIRLLANGLPAIMDELRCLGNAIVPQVAAEFIKATM